MRDSFAETYSPAVGTTNINDWIDDKKGENTMAVVTKGLHQFENPKNGKVNSIIKFKIDGEKFDQTIYANQYNRPALEVLNVGAEIEVEKDGNFWKLASKKNQNQETSEEVFNSMSSNSNQKSNGKNNVKKLLDIIKELENGINSEIKTSFSPEDIRSMAISLFIQSSR